MDLKNFFLKTTKCLAFTVIALSPLMSRAYAYPTISTVPDDTSPDFNQDTVVSIFVDLSSGTDELGAYTLEINWDAAVAQYDSTSGGTSNGFTSVSNINESNVASGNLKLNHFYVPGTGGNVHVADIHFTAIGGALDSTAFTPVVQTLSAAETFADLKPGHDVITGSITIPQPTITVTSPNGGESWTATDVHNITWTSVNVATVSIDYSTDSGGSWLPVTSSTPSTGSFSWTLPDVTSSTCYVRVTDTASAASDQSDGTFTIEQEPTITVISPNGGETWIGGHIYTITWNAVNVSNVNIEYSPNNGAAWFSVATSLDASAGSYSWTAPNFYYTNYLIKIRDSGDPGVSDLSDAVFTIYKTSLSLTDPNGGENLIAGTSYDITWDTSYIDSLSIHYSVDNGSNWTDITVSTDASTGSYAWIVPAESSDECLVRLTDTASAIADTSASAFSILNPSVTVTAPNGGESWTAGSSQNITWSSTDVSTVTIEYSDDSGSSWNPVASGVTASTGTHTWTVAAVSSSDCYIRISDDASSAMDQSDTAFSIQNPSVTVTAPNGGQSWTVGSSQNITWSATDVTNVKIEFSDDNGSTWTDIIASTAASAESYEWTVPTVSSAECLVRVSDTDGSPSDTSDGAFTILNPSVTVTAPNGGQSWTAGSSQNITWSATDVTNVKIEFSVDNGTNWTDIIASTAASAESYEWTVPTVSSAECLVRVSDTDGSPSDTSDGAFTIQNPSVTVTAPNGGQSWTVGSSQNITWSATDVTNVKIEFSDDNGSTWTDIIASTAASAESYEWTVPTVSSAECLVRVSDTDGSPSDTSDGAFTILNPSVTVTAPDGVESWTAGTTENITWSASDIATVLIEYSADNGSNWTAIDTDVTASAGTYAWTVPAVASDECLVRISDTASSAADTSDAVFTIVNLNPSVTVTSPNGGESWVAGSSHAVTWSATDISTVKIEYSSNNGTSWTTIIASTDASAESYSWTLPVMSSSSCLVRVSDTSGSPSDTSDDVFSIIQPSITVLSPNGGESYTEGNICGISWTSSNVTNVSISYTTNGGSSWITITSSTSSDGSYSWTVPSTSSSSCQIMVSDIASSATDQSDGYFSISLTPPPPTLSLTSPNGGESWLGGSIHNITWNSSNVSSIKIEFSADGGTNWNVIEASTPASFRFILMDGYQHAYDDRPYQNFQYRQPFVERSQFIEFHNYQPAYNHGNVTERRRALDCRNNAKYHMDSVGC